MSQSDESPAVQGDVHYESALGWFAGLPGFTRCVSYDNENKTVQLNAFAGLRWMLDDELSAKLVLSHYAHPWDSGGTPLRLRRCDSPGWRGAIGCSSVRCGRLNMSLITATAASRPIARHLAYDD